MITTTIEDLYYKLEILKKVDLSINDKLTHAIKRINAQYTQQTRLKLAQLNSKVKNEIIIPKAAVDADGIIIVKKSYENPNPDGYVFKPADLVYVNEETQKLHDGFNLSTITIDGYLVTDINEAGFNRLVDHVGPDGKFIPAIFDEFEKEELAGILFPVIDDKKEVPTLEMKNQEPTHDQEVAANV